MAIADVRREIEATERLRASFGAIAARTDDRRRHALVELRRAQSVQVNRLTAACEQLFAAAPAAHLARDYRDRTSRMRAALAAHQANWPAVGIDDDPVAYRASASVARAAEQECIRWLEAVLDALDGRGTLPIPGA